MQAECVVLTSQLKKFVATRSVENFPLVVSFVNDLLDFEVARPFA